MLNRASAVLEPAAPARATPGAARAQRTHVLGLRTRKVETCERNESAERCSQWAASGIHRCGTAPHPEASSSPTRRTSTCRRTESPSAAHERSRSDPALSAHWAGGKERGAPRGVSAKARAAAEPSAPRRPFVDDDHDVEHRLIGRSVLVEKSEELPLPQYPVRHAKKRSDPNKRAGPRHPARSRTQPYTPSIALSLSLLNSLFKVSAEDSDHSR